MWVRGHSRSLKLTAFESLGAVSYSPSIKNCGAILYRWRDISSYWSKMAIFFIPHLYLAPLKGVTPSEFREDV